ncbi:MAG: hypothetical protein ACOCRX_11865, partial [Candidatus Woesearchaeota archaeon]
MQKQKIVNELKNLRLWVSDFEKVCKKYPKSHNHYYHKHKHLKLKVKKLLQINKIQGDIKYLINNFINEEDKDPKKCKFFIDKLDEKIQDLEIELEKKQNSFSERIYDKKSSFRFHLDIKEILEKSKNEIFFLEPFVDDHILEITLKDISRNLKVNILTNSRNADKRKKFDKLSNLFKNDFDGFEVRETEDLHDRGFFIDEKEGWVMGQSVKDAARNKPTYLIRLENYKKLKDI